MSKLFLLTFYLLFMLHFLHYHLLEIIYVISDKKQTKKTERQKNEGKSQFQFVTCNKKFIGEKEVKRRIKEMKAHVK